MLEDNTTFTSDNHQNNNLDSSNLTLITERNTEIWQNNSGYENNSVTMESLFQSEYNLKNIPMEIQQFVKYLKQEKG